MGLSGAYLMMINYHEHPFYITDFCVVKPSITEMISNFIHNFVKDEITQSLNHALT